MSSLSESLSAISALLTAIRDEQALRREAGGSEASSQESSHTPSAVTTLRTPSFEHEILALKSANEALRTELSLKMAAVVDLQSVEESLRQRLSASQLECSATKQRLSQVNSSRAEERRVMRELTNQAKETTAGFCRVATDVGVIRQFDVRTSALLEWLMPLALSSVLRYAHLEKEVLLLQSEQIMWSESRCHLANVCRELHASRDSVEELEARLAAQGDMLADMQRAQRGSISRFEVETAAAEERAVNAERALVEVAATLRNTVVSFQLPPLTLEVAVVTGLTTEQAECPVGPDPYTLKAQLEVECANRQVAEEQLRCLQSSALHTISTFVTRASVEACNLVEMEALRQRAASLEAANEQLSSRVVALAESHDSIITDAKDLQHYVAHMEASLVDAAPTLAGVLSTANTTTNCSGCHHTVETTSAVRCTQCAGTFHRSCARFPKNDAKFVCDAHKTNRRAPHR